MIKDVKSYVEQYATFDLPVEYKGLQIHPFKVKDNFNFYTWIDIFKIDRTKIDNIELRKMSYLKFIYLGLFLDTQNYEGEVVGNIWQDKFYNILAKSFQVDFDEIGIGIDEDERAILLIKDVVINHKEFDEIRKIILYQNIFDYIDIKMSQDVREVFEKSQRMKSKNITQPTLEEQMSVITSETGILKKDMLEMTCREFDILFTTVVEKIDYTINKRADLQNKEFKEPIPHWIFQKNKDILDGVLVDKGKLDDKMKYIT